MTLIPKKGDRHEIKDKRPICLLDVVYKLVAKVIANRIGVVANNLISPEQTGFIKGRFIGENLRLKHSLRAAARSGCGCLFQSIERRSQQLHDA